MSGSGFNRFSKGLAVFVLVLLALSAWFYFLDGFSAETKIVDIPQGIGLVAIGEKLEGEGGDKKSGDPFFSRLFLVEPRGSLSTASTSSQPTRLFIPFTESCVVAKCL